MKVKNIRIPKEITVLVDDRLVDYFDEIVEELETDKRVFNKKFYLQDGRYYMWGFKNNRYYKIFIFEKGQTVQDAFSMPATELVLPKKYNAMITHMYNSYTNVGYALALINGEIQPPTIG